MEQCNIDFCHCGVALHLSNWHKNHVFYPNLRLMDQKKLPKQHIKATGS